MISVTQKASHSQISCKTHGPLWFIILINSVTADFLSFFCDGVMRHAEIKLGQVGKKRQFFMLDWWLMKQQRKSSSAKPSYFLIAEKNISMKSIQVNFLCFYLLSFYGKRDNPLREWKHLIFLMINDRIYFKAESHCHVCCFGFYSPSGTS